MTRSPSCDLSAYKAGSGLVAANASDGLRLLWDGEKDQQLRLRLAIDGGTPTIRDLSVRSKNGDWATLATNVTPEYRVVSGIRRMTNQQLEPLVGLKVELTPEIVDKYKWDAFWDAPLNLGPAPARGGGNPPPAAGVANQPGLPRKPEEIQRADAVYQATGCSVKTNGSRIEVSFPGVQLGVFDGRLQYTIYKGHEPDPAGSDREDGSGFRGLQVRRGTEGPRDSRRRRTSCGVTCRPRGRTTRWRKAGLTRPALRPKWCRCARPIVLSAAQWANGSIAAFPAPHNFFWSREIDTVLGYNYYRRDGASSFSIGIRQPESEDDPAVANRGGADYAQNFALYSARPGTMQKMPVYFYVSPDAGQAAIQGALAFTRGDHYKPLPGYQVMATHYHTGFLNRLRTAGSLDAPLPDLIPIKAAGINIMAPIDGGSGAGGGRGQQEKRLKDQADWYALTKMHSERGFVIMPDEEVFNSPLGGHTDLLLSHPVYWTNDRNPGQPFVETDPVHGNVYHVGSGADMIEMVNAREHPDLHAASALEGIDRIPRRDQGPPRIPGRRMARDRFPVGHGARRIRAASLRLPLLAAARRHEQLGRQPAGAAEVRAGDRRGLPAGARRRHLRQHARELREARRRPGTGRHESDRQRDAPRRLFLSARARCSSRRTRSRARATSARSSRTSNGPSRWNLPRSSGATGRRRTARSFRPPTWPAFGKKHFEIPFNAEGKAWVRFAVWDSAGNGAVVQPIKLTNLTTTAAVNQAGRGGSEDPPDALPIRPSSPKISVCVRWA